ncbi:MAG: hypothetical protein ACKOI2_13940 [Actinomycetota bacterium]
MVDDSLPPPPPPRQRLSITARLALIAFGTAIVASFLPWVRVLFVTVNGTDGDGVISLVAGGIGFGSVILSERSTRRLLLVHASIVVSAALTSIVFVYNLADVSRTAGESSNDIFDLQVSPQFGLVVGAVAAPIALFCGVLRLSQHLTSRSLTKRNLTDGGAGGPEPWTPSDLLVSCIAVATLPIAVAPTLWALSAVLVIALAAILWFAARRSRIRRTCAVLSVIGIVIAAGGTVYGIVDTDNSTTLSSAMTDSLQGFPVDDLETCSNVYASGTSTNDIDEPSLCLDSGVETYVFPVTWECEDGRTLVSTEYGWGYIDDTWSTVGEAPYDRCRSSAEVSCADIFSDGTSTNESWVDDVIECFDANGEIDYVLTTRWDCFDSDEVQLSNRYGWGYLGKKWVGGEDAPFC